MSEIKPRRDMQAHGDLFHCECGNIIHISVMSEAVRKMTYDLAHSKGRVSVLEADLRNLALALANVIGAEDWRDE